jgi:hypothetical protein
LRNRAFDGANVQHLAHPGVLRGPLLIGTFMRR